MNKKHKISSRWLAGKCLLLFLLPVFYIIIFISGCNNNSQKSPVISDSLKKESVEALRTILKTQSEWVKVHAAEFLLWSGYPDNVRNIFLEEEKYWGNKSPYRIGIWRVLSQVTKKPEEKEIWTGKIMQAFLDTNGTDRIHAAETLAKLHISPLVDSHGITVKTMNSLVRSLSLYTRWSVGFSSQDSLISVRTLFFNIATSGNEDASSRKLAVYVLCHSGSLAFAEWEKLARIALLEPEGSALKINLLNAAVITANNDAVPGDLYGRVYEAFLKFKKVAKKAIRMEIAAGLAEKGKPEDLPILISFLRNEIPLGQDTDDADVRASAAFAILKMSARFALIY